MIQSREFLAGGGAVGALMRTHDWSSSPLGPPDSWPQSLRTVVSLLLQSRFPMFVAWGKDLGFLYNDAYAEILGSKHPHALGHRFYDIGAYQFVYDVTDRLRDQERLRTAEAALRQTQKMESLGQLTGGVAHDFNNLLAVFASGLQLLERTAAQGIAPKPRVFEAMRRAIARGTGLTRHLLAFSRRRPVNPEAIDVIAHLKGMRTMLDGSLGGHIEVRMEFGQDVWPVEVDAGEMELAILNLCHAPPRSRRGRSSRSSRRRTSAKGRAWACRRFMDLPSSPLDTSRSTVMSAWERS
jgi:signal transduction histidine kinase